LFPTCSIQVPNGFPTIPPFFNEGITQHGDKKGFNRHQGGKANKGQKMGGKGEGKDIVAIKKFLAPQLNGN
jgi:hypothetical protein